MALCTRTGSRRACGSLESDGTIDSKRDRLFSPFASGKCGLVLGGTGAVTNNLRIGGSFFLRKPSAAAGLRPTPQPNPDGSALRFFSHSPLGSSKHAGACFEIEQVFLTGRMSTVCDFASQNACGAVDKRLPSPAPPTRLDTCRSLSWDIGGHRGARKDQGKKISHAGCRVQCGFRRFGIGKRLSLNSRTIKLRCQVIYNVHIESTMRTIVLFEGSFCSIDLSPSPSTEKPT